METEFLGYLNQWEQAVAQRQGFSDAEKKNMLLSAETSSGLKLTGTLTQHIVHVHASHLGYILSIMQ